VAAAPPVDLYSLDLETLDAAPSTSVSAFAWFCLVLHCVAPSLGWLAGVLPLPTRNN